MDNLNQPLDADLSSGENHPNNGLRITQTIRQYWHESSQWALFFAVLGFLYLGLVLVVLLTAGSKLGTAGIPVFFVLLLVGGLIFPPVWFMFQFSRHIKQSLQNDDTQAAATGFQNLRRLYQFAGVLTAIVLGLYGIILLFSLLFLAVGR